MMKVKLKAETKLIEEGVDKDELLALASHAALKCYQARTPKIGEMINVEARLFNPGHHTTLEHHSFTFDVEGIAVSDITLGAHLGAPFYNSDQRSGRFCAEMFLSPDFSAIDGYIKYFWPEISAPQRAKAMKFVNNGVGVYRKYLGAATKLAGEFIAKERPRASGRYIENNAPKIAQEQLRMFIPAIFPTGFDFTIDLITLASLYKAAWTPGLLYLTKQMADQVLARHPDIGYMFSRRGKEWAPKILRQRKIKFKPTLILRELPASGRAVIPASEDMHPVDLLHFLPEYMDNNTNDVKTSVEISLACLGQDQRHRTVRRSEPVLTGNFYLPPLPAMLPGVIGLAQKSLNSWLDLVKIVPPSLAAAIAPYGAMVKYTKSGSFNAIFHEQHKRECWCAQEEIYHLGVALRLAIEKAKGKKYPVLRVLEPHCYRAGVCAEGPRYCGRDISLRESGDYFPERRV